MAFLPHKGHSIFSFLNRKEAVLPLFLGIVVFQLDLDFLEDVLLLIRQYESSSILLTVFRILQWPLASSVLLVCDTDDFDGYHTYPPLTLY